MVLVVGHGAGGVYACVHDSLIRKCLSLRAFTRGDAHFDRPTNHGVVVECSGVVLRVSEPLGHGWAHQIVLC